MTTFSDIQAAANKLSSGVTQPGMTMLINNGWYANGGFNTRNLNTFLTDYPQYLSDQGSNSCMNDKESDYKLFQALYDPLTALDTLGIVMNENFMPYWNLVNENQSLLSANSLKYWNDSFNTKNLKVDDSTSITVADFAKAIAGFDQNNSTCPAWNTDLQDAINCMKYVVPWDSTNAVRMSMVNCNSSTNLQPSSGVLGASDDLMSTAVYMSTRAAQINLSDVKYWTMEDVFDAFTADYETYVQLQDPDALCITPNKNNMPLFNDMNCPVWLPSLIDVIEFVTDFYLPFYKQVQSAGSQLPSATLAWFNTNFEATSDDMGGLSEFATAFAPFATGEQKACPTWSSAMDKALPWIAKFTPWDSTNTLRQAMIDAPSKVSS